MLIEAQSGQGGSGERMTWTTAERTQRGQPRGSGRGPNGAERGMTSLPKESRDNGLAGSLLPGAVYR